MNLRELEKNVVIEPDHPGKGSLVPSTMERDLKAEKKERSAADKVSEELSKFLLELWNKCEKFQEKDWLEIRKQMVTYRKYYDNKQNGYVTDSLEWRDFDLKKDEVRYTKNIVRPHTDTAMMELSRGKTHLTFSHIAPDSRRGDKIAKLAAALYTGHKKRIFSVAKMAQENLALLEAGIAARYTYFAMDKSGEKIPVVTEKEYKDEGVEVCTECQSLRKGADECDRCGSDSFTIIGAEEGRAPSLGGYEEIKEGRANWVSADPLGLTFSLNAVTVADSPFLIWRQVALTDQLKAAYKGIKITSGLKSHAMRYKYRSDTAPTDSFGQAGEEESGGEVVAEIAHGWFDYELYCDKKLEQETTLANGKVLPAGTVLGEAFPDGLYLLRNGDSFLDMWNESKNDKWDICPYVTRMGTMVGAGLHAILDEQDIINDLRNLKMASITRDSFPLEFINPMYLENEDVPNDPTERAIITNLPAGERIVGTVIDRLPGTPLSSDVYAFDDSVEQSAQNIAGTFSTGGAGMPDLNAIKNTATAFLAYRETTIGRFAPMLELRADLLDKEQMYKLLEIDQKYRTPAQWERLKGDYGADAIEAFLDCNIREEIMIEVAYESYMPQTTSQKISNVQAYLPMVGALAQMGVTPESEYGSYLAGLFGQPAEHTRFDKDYDAALAYVQELGEIADAIIGEVGGEDIPRFSLTDPVALALSELVYHESAIEVSEHMDNHAAMIESLRDWWVKDAGKHASNLHKASVLYLMRELKGASVAAAQDDIAMEQAVQAPLLAQQAQMEEEARAMDAEAQAADDERMVVQGMADMSEADAQREHEQELKDKDMEIERERTAPVGIGVGKGKL